MEGVNPSGFHLLWFYDGFMILSDHQLTTLASKFGIAIQQPDTMVAELKKRFPVKIRYWIAGGLQRALPAPQPCTWNMFVKRRCESNWNFYRVAFSVNGML